MHEENVAESMTEERLAELGRGVGLSPADAQELFAEVVRARRRESALAENAAALHGFLEAVELRVEALRDDLKAAQAGRA